MEKVIRVTATDNQKVIIPVSSISYVYGNTIVTNNLASNSPGSTPVKYVVKETNDAIWAQMK